MKKLLFPTILLLAFGCAPQKQWYKDGTTPQDFSMDQGQCKAQAFSISGGNMMQIAIVFNSCMQGKGWNLQ